VGYIVYESFNGTNSDLNGSARQIEEILNKFKRDGKKDVIIDLRNNGGGYMSILSKIVCHFIDAGDGKKALISVAVDKHGEREEYFSSKCDYSRYGFENIIILANENTSSASEAFIGAVLDYDKKGIVKVLVSSSIKNGEKVYKTYGKGIMQNTFANLDGSAVKLTIAEIFWPISNVSIHKKGVIGEDSGKVLKVEKENALNYALELLK
jgi:carboxyl-terminal processing protease